MRHNHVLSLQKTAIETVLAFHIEMYQKCPYYIEFAAGLLGSSHLQQDLLLAAASGLEPLANQLPSLDPLPRTASQPVNHTSRHHSAA